MASLRTLLLLALIALICATHVVRASVREEESDDDREDKDKAGKDGSYGGECNGHKEDDDEYWENTPSKKDLTYNDDIYKTCSKKVCKPPRVQACEGTCSNSSGVQSVFVLPNNGQCKAGTAIMVASNTSPYCVASSISVEECCKRAKSSNAYYWQHYIPAGGCSGCGRCFLYKSLAPKPVCVKTVSNKRLEGNVSTIGKTCPFGYHDPHFMGAQGTLFEFNGMPERSFCLLTDRHLHVNMKMRGYLDTRTVGASILKDGRAVRTWIRELGIMWDDTLATKHSLRLVARDGKSMSRDAGFLKSIEVDGKALPLLKLGETYSRPSGLKLAFTAYEKQGGGFFDADVYEVEIEGKLKLRVTLRAAHPLLQTPEDAEVHLNVQFVKVVHTADVHGVMGQTYRGGREKRSMDYSSLSQLLGRTLAADSESGKGFLDGNVKDYETASVLATDCAFTAYDGRQLPSTK